MDEEERDVEVFERIPWDSLQPSSDRRWLVYLVAAALVMGAVGVTVGRSLVSPAAPLSNAASTAVSTMPPTTTPIGTPPISNPAAPTVATVPSTSLPEPEAWSEADLMAVPAGALEDAAAAIAEWYVADYFTRDGTTESGRSFVEWVRAVGRQWVAADVIDVTVALRRLAARGDDPYERIPLEGWLVSTRLDDGEWVVVAGPRPVEAPSLRVEFPGDEDGDNANGTEWVDQAGLEWVVPPPRATP